MRKKKFSSGNEGGGVKPIITGSISILHIVTGFYWRWAMLVKCRKCGLVFDLTNKENTLEGVMINHVNELQTMTCGAGGTHRLIGVIQ